MTESPTVKQQYVRALTCLALELPESVYDDATAKIRAHVEALEARLTEMETAIRTWKTAREAFNAANADTASLEEFTYLCAAAAAARDAVLRLI